MSGYYGPRHFGEDTTTYGMEYDRSIFENYGLSGDGSSQQDTDTDDDNEDE